MLCVLGELTFLSLCTASLYPWYFSVLKSALREINIATLEFLWLVLAWYICPYPFTFNLPMSLYLKCVSCRQHIVAFIFFYFKEILSESLHLLICVFRPFIFRVIIDIFGFMSTMFVTVSYSLPWFFVSIIVLHYFFYLVWF